MYSIRPLWAAITMVIMIILIAVILIYLPLSGNKYVSMQTRTLTKMKLPSPVYSSNVSIEQALKTRRSIRHYKNEPMTLQQISQLLWAAQGITSSEGFRTAPSAGALYPLEVYLISGNVRDLLPGVYHYLPQEHVLELVAEGDKRADLAAAALDQNDVKMGAADIVITAVYARTTAKYGSRGERYVHMEAGHAAENVCLQVTSLGLGMVTIGAFDDAKVSALFGLAGREYPLYILPVGKV